MQHRKDVSNGSTTKRSQCRVRRHTRLHASSVRVIFCPHTWYTSDACGGSTTTHRKAYMLHACCMCKTSAGRACPRRSISSLRSFFIAYMLPDARSRHSRTWVPSCNALNVNASRVEAHGSCACLYTTMQPAKRQGMRSTHLNVACRLRARSRYRKRHLHALPPEWQEKKACRCDIMCTETHSPCSSADKGTFHREEGRYHQTRLALLQQSPRPALGSRARTALTRQAGELRASSYPGSLGASPMCRSGAEVRCSKRHRPCAVAALSACYPPHKGCSGSAQ